MRMSKTVGSSSVQGVEMWARKQSVLLVEVNVKLVELK